MINLYDLLAACNGQLFGDPAGQLFADFSFDPRAPQTASLYVALKTDRDDGHRHLAEAVRQGASGLLCSRPPAFDTTGLSVVVVRDTLDALIAWIGWRLERLKARRIVVAGDGAALTAEVARHILASHVTVCGDTVTTDWPSLACALAANGGGGGIALFQVTGGDEALSDALAVLQPDMVIAPGAGASALALAYDALGPDGLLVARQRDLLNRTKAGARVATIALEEFGADVTAYNVVYSLNGAGFDLRHGAQRYAGRWTSLLGRRGLRSVLCGLAAAPLFEIAVEDALKSIRDIQSPPGHLRPLAARGGGLLIDGTAIPDAAGVTDVLEWLEAAKAESRAILIAGDLDADAQLSDAQHRELGHRAAGVVDLLIGQGPEAANMAYGALAAGMNRRQASITYGAAETLARLRSEGALKADDVIVVIGGGAARMAQVVRALLADPADASLLAGQDDEAFAALRDGPARPSWVELDLDALAGNVRQLKTLVGRKVVLTAVVKADAYGAGAVTVARVALLNGAERLAVASIHEALELREAGIQAPILVLSYTPPAFARQAARRDIALTVYDAGLARAYDRAARGAGRRLRVHLKIDTGMGRLGVMPGEARSLARLLVGLAGLEPEGVFTHFSTADEDPEYTGEQARVFMRIVDELREAGIRPKLVHAANSAATLAFPEYHFNMVRVGLALHGLSPSEQVRVPEGFRPILSWKSFVAQVKTLPDGHPVGYGNTYRCEGEQRIAVLPLGYSDGFRRAPNAWSHVLVHGQPAPVVGRVSMEKTAINVTHIPDVAIGDEVVLLGEQGGARITADEIAQRLGTISYEVLCGILARVPRR